MFISQKAIDAIIFFEVSSINFYNKFLQSPTWPLGESGITIGIGYDLGYNTKDEIKKDLGEHVSETDLNKLLFVAGLKGAAAKNALTPEIKAIKIPFDIAEDVFIHTSLPKAANQAKIAYNGIEQLMPDAIGGLTSLVYNRGTSMVGDRRKEMAAIKPLVLEKDYDGIADQIISMKRLWNKSQSGLLERRDIEASLVRHSVREYKQEELIEIK